MERFRSNSTKDGRMQRLDNIWPHPYAGGDQDMVVVAAPPSLRELRSYSTSYVSSPYEDPVAPPPLAAPSSSKMKKSKTTNWSLIKDPELQRKKRVAGYKAYGIERKMKGSFGKSFKWIKNGCHHVFGGGWW